MLKGLAVITYSVVLAPIWLPALIIALALSGVGLSFAVIAKVFHAFGFLFHDAATWVLSLLESFFKTFRDAAKKAFNYDDENE